MTIPGSDCVVSVALGDHHSIVVGASGRVYGCGIRSALGRAACTTLCSIELSVDAKCLVAAASTYSTLLLCRDGSVLACGDNGYGQLGLGDRVSRSVPTLLPLRCRAVAVHCGPYHSMVRLADGTLLRFGRNQGGELGLGDFEDRVLPTATDADNVAYALSCVHRG